MKGHDYTQKYDSLFEAAEEMMKDIRPELESPGCTGLIMICGVQTEDGGFIRFCAGGRLRPSFIAHFFESIPALLGRFKQRAGRSAKGEALSLPAYNSKAVH
jgi:hypothetical protein